eukprot:SAG31_NODE_46040_length_256_cov_0.656051_1_plen_21_part_10
MQANAYLPIDSAVVHNYAERL